MDNVININRKKELDNIHKNIKNNKMTFSKKVKKKVKEWGIKGFQINRCYDSDWDFITDVFEKYNLNLNKHGPIITINEKKHVEFVEKLIKEINDNPSIDYKKKFELTSIGYDNLFILFLRIYPEFCRQIASESFKKWLIKGDSSKYLRGLCSIGGTIKETDEKIENFVSDIVKNLK